MLWDMRIMKERLHFQKPDRIFMVKKQKKIVESLGQEA